ncbi:EF-P 5-aminopentanol modification-associated protein YfmF [Companilactobacillus sp.]|uniref:EF-P 5-aminopentanol modification-associated protein YfmF n=1 Tax=Companilactobacillus sp. TaxID=2767905 RepID=UPI0025C3BA86|nr:insulinase family protein [Companilactobacillus sp.]MCH4008816.1 insulinase family protein [Companilactobacillus sp.]MCH4051005.1 insulinase family protein [Companilactobacillus sp.]MCH4076759.1 insulinase family protein [Companilactobacillus sp.]MCH4125334.1 insulinase family protein [Companilactobacillus sp.]MCH4131874.1 insulinase family protein [Companilactobacillus sp.]
MRETLAKNVVLNVKQLNQFRTIKIQIDFLRPINKDESTKRRLLANVLSNSTEKFPSFKALNDREMELYGAEISAYTRSLLNFNDLGFSIEFADPGFLIGDTNQVQNNLELLREIIFEPNLKNEHEFDQTAFDVEKRNMMSNLEAVVDNQDLVSMLELSKLIHHANPDKLIPLFGDKTQLASLENAELLDYYRDVVKNDFVLINVVGNVDGSKFLDLFKSQFADVLLKQQRSDLKIKFENFDDLIENPAKKADHKEVNQSRLAIGYVSDKLEKGSSHIAPQAMNLIFGGDDQSQLFLQVREKNSLAYSVSSTYQPNNHLLSISAGLDASSMDQAISLINDQLQFMKDGKFTDDQIEHAKKVLFTRRAISSDSIQHYIMRSIWECVYPEAMLDEEEYKQELAKLDRKHIISVANNLHLIAEYKLIGE